MLNRNIKILIILSLLISLISISFVRSENTQLETSRETKASGPLEDELAKLEAQIKAIRDKKNGIKSRINSENAKQSQYGAEIAQLAGEISLKQADIEEIQLEIDKLNVQIEILEFSIEQTGEDIVQTEGEVKDLNDKTSEDLQKMYLKQKIKSEADWVISPTSSTNFVKQNVYQKTVQESVNSELNILKEKRSELEDKKKQLDEDKITVEKDKKGVDEQKLALEREKTSLSQKKSVLDRKMRESLNNEQQEALAYSQSSDEERRLLAESEKIRQQIFNNLPSVPSGSFVVAGTTIGIEGNTGWSTGPHLHFGTAFNGVTQNPCNFVNCGGKSDGQIKWPLSPKGVVTSGYGYRSGSFHAAIDISTGGGARVLAAHDGWLIRGKQYCRDLTWVKCNGGYANYVIICQDKNNCNKGYKTMYWHLAN